MGTVRRFTALLVRYRLPAAALLAAAVTVALCLAVPRLAIRPAPPAAAEPAAQTLQPYQRDWTGGWSRDLKAKGEDDFGPDAHWLTADSIVVATGTALHAARLSDGRTLWTATARSLGGSKICSVSSSTAGGLGGVVLGDDEKTPRCTKVAAVATATGKAAWSRTTRSWNNPRTGPNIGELNSVMVSDTWLVAGGYDTDELRRYRLADGTPKGILKATHAGCSLQAAENRDQRIVDYEVCMQQGRDVQERLMVSDVKTGKLLWHDAVGLGNWSAGVVHPIRVLDFDPVVVLYTPTDQEAHDLVITYSRVPKDAGGGLAGIGQVVGQYSPDTVDAQGRMLTVKPIGTPVVHDGIVYVEFAMVRAGQTDHLDIVAFDTATGRPLWRRTVAHGEDDTQPRPLVSADASGLLVLVPGGTGYTQFLHLAAADGAERYGGVLRPRKGPDGTGTTGLLPDLSNETGADTAIVQDGRIVVVDGTAVTVRNAPEVNGS